MSVFGRRGVSKAPTGGESVSAVDEGERFTLVDSGDAIKAYRDELSKTGDAILQKFNEHLNTLEIKGLAGLRGLAKKIESADKNEYEIRLNDGIRLFFRDNGDGTFTIIKRRGNHL